MKSSTVTKDNIFLETAAKLANENNPALDILIENIEQNLSIHKDQNFTVRNNSKEMKIIIAGILNAAYLKSRGFEREFHWEARDIMLEVKPSDHNTSHFHTIDSNNSRKVSLHQQRYLNDQKKEETDPQKPTGILHYDRGTLLHSDNLQDALEQIKEHYLEIRLPHIDMRKYIEGVNSAYDANDHEKIISATEKIATKYSNLSKEKIIENAKKMIKQMKIAKGKKESSFYTAKENCKWIFNKLTFGLTPSSASKKIDTVFEKIPKTIRECQSKADAKDILELMEEGTFKSKSSAGISPGHIELKSTISRR